MVTLVISSSVFALATCITIVTLITKFTRFRMVTVGLCYHRYFGY
jgi:hypothetical protein